MTYPPFDRKWKLHGRLSGMEVHGPLLTAKLHNGLQIKVLYREEYGDLQLQDWIALDHEERIHRVAPSKRQPLVPAAPLELLLKWSEFLTHVKAYFTQNSFVEIQTPSLVDCPGTEPTLSVFETHIKVGSTQRKKFLPTSPELHLKKALTMGFERIFEITRCYRNDEFTDLHQPEFWMLEWYRSFANLLDIQVDCVRLIRFISERMHWQGPLDIECVSIRSLFKKYLNYDLTPTTSRDEYLALARSAGIEVRDHHSIDDLFFLLMLEKIEPNFSPEKLVFVEKYPPFQAALARRNHEGWAERFEIYWKSMELANAFDELNDPDEQRKRSQEDLLKRTHGDPIELDEEFFQALESGMPPSAGIALGLDRLFMAFMNIKKIQETRLFSH